MTPSSPPENRSFPDSLSTLESGFASGLHAILEQHPGLGVHILVLANAAYDPDLWTQLSPELQLRHTALADSITRVLQSGARPAEPDDDLMVFLMLMAIGFEQIRPVQHRLIEPWKLSFNPVRALRPPRMSGAPFSGLQRAFDPSAFHFNKPFLAREIFWQGELAGKSARLLYNKFPFARLHGLLLPDPQRELPQYLTPELHGWAWSICNENAVPGFSLAYNSQGAGASVNHLHFQSFAAQEPLPVEDTQFQHNGGNLPYPLHCTRFSDPHSAWSAIDALHQRNIPYNLLYTRQTLYLIPRATQGSPTIPKACQSWGWSEMTGVINVFERAQFDTLTAADIHSMLQGFVP